MSNFGESILEQIQQHPKKITSVLIFYIWAVHNFLPLDFPEEIQT